MMIQTLASDPRVRTIASRTVSDVEPSQPAGVVMQWVVVTTWQGGEETRTVLTTANVADCKSRDGSGAISSRADLEPSEQVRPYAAVPVQGGWLVFRL